MKKHTVKNKRYWFAAKRYGWGWYPATWEGYTVLSIYLLSLLIISLFMDTNRPIVQSSFLPLILLLTALLLIICYYTGEKPGWHWGD